VKGIRSSKSSKVSSQDILDEVTHAVLRKEFGLCNRFALHELPITILAQASTIPSGTRMYPSDQRKRKFSHKSEESETQSPHDDQFAAVWDSGQYAEPVP
jgi:hypothetical protein